MNAFAALLAEMPDEPWHIDAKDRFPESEDARQAALLRDARIICPAVDIFAVPNAGKRTRWEAAKRKREGMRAGVLDLVCTWKPTRPSDRGVAFIEMKDGTSMPDDNQRERLNRYYRCGLPCGVFRTAASAIAFLASCGAPVLVRERRL